MENPPEDETPTQDQVEALAALHSRQSVFLTGEPGAGKSWVIKRFMKESKRSIALTASTGIAAANVRGKTIHSWSGLGALDDLREEDILSICRWSGKSIRRAQTLIIDEISMLSGDFLQMLDLIMQTARRRTAPFGGVQMIFVGDFFQLPPVQGKGKPPFRHKFAFSAPAWRTLNPRVCYLTEQHRQKDPEFSRVLTAIRNGRGDLNDPALFLRQPVKGITQLLTHNGSVDHLNEKELRKLPNESVYYHMKSFGEAKSVAALKRGCLSPEVLELRLDAQVMFTKNDKYGQYVNGTQGRVIDLDRRTVTVETEDRLCVRIALDSWSIPDREGEIVDTSGDKPFPHFEIPADDGEYEYDEDEEEDCHPKLPPKPPLACISQIPLRLAWAVTVHKSQGMTLTAANIDLSQAFEWGQGYVALSRVKTLSGLFLFGINARALMVDPDVLEMDKVFRATSRCYELKSFVNQPTMKPQNSSGNASFHQTAAAHAAASTPRL